jgi:hypothetical protein
VSTAVNVEAFGRRAGRLRRCARRPAAAQAVVILRIRKVCIVLPAVLAGRGPDAHGEPDV